MTVGSGHLTRSLCTKCSCITTLPNNNWYAKGSPPVVEVDLDVDMDVDRDGDVDLDVDVDLTWTWTWTWMWT